MPWPCGAADFVQQFASHLSEAGHAVTVLTSNASAVTTDERRHVEVLPGCWNLRHVRQVANWLKQRDFDVVDFQYEAAMYGHSAKALFLPLFLRRRMPLVLTLHSQDLPRRARRLSRLLQMVPYEAVVFYSASFCERMKSWMPRRASRYYVQGFPANIQPAMSPTLAPVIGRLKAGWPDPFALLVYFGHINRGRGIEEIMDALLALRARGVRPQLVLISKFDPTEDDYHRALLNWVRAEGLADQVTFAGRLEAERVSQLLQAADVCVLPFPDGASFKNGSLAAAITHAIPTVTTVSELTEPELLAAGALQTYRPGDSNALAALLHELLRSPDHCHELRRRMVHLQQLVAWETYIGTRMAIYQSAQKAHACRRKLLSCSAFFATRKRSMTPAATSALPAAIRAPVGGADSSALCTR